MPSTLNLFRYGAVGFIDWLDGGVISSYAFACEVPVPVRDFNVRDVSWIKRDTCMASHLRNEGMMNDRDILDHSTITESECNDLVIHSSLWLYKEELAPVFRQRRIIHLTS